MPLPTLQERAGLLCCICISPFHALCQASERYLSCALLRALSSGMAEAIALRDGHIPDREGSLALQCLHDHGHCPGSRPRPQRLVIGEHPHHPCIGLDLHDVAMLLMPGRSEEGWRVLGVDNLPDNDPRIKHQAGNGSGPGARHGRAAERGAEQRGRTTAMLPEEAEGRPD